MAYMDSGHLLPLTTDGAEVNFIHIFRHSHVHTGARAQWAFKGAFIEPATGVQSTQSSVGNDFNQFPGDRKLVIADIDVLPAFQFREEPLSGVISRASIALAGLFVPAALIGAISIAARRRHPVVG